MKNFYKVFIAFLTGLLFMSSAGVMAQIDHPVMASYKYLKGSQAAAISSNWMSSGFDDNAWTTASAPFWYGDGAGGTEITDMQYNYTTFYLRSVFEAQNAANIQEVTFRINYDDGFVIWVNGAEVLNMNAPPSRAYNDSATAQHEYGIFEEFTVSGFDIDLVEGTNTIAIQAFNVNLPSSDFHFDMSISATTDIPVFDDSLGLEFNYSSGYYDDPFDLTITSLDVEADIIYTIDGSNPQESASAITAGNSVVVSIDPSITAGRAATPGFLVRASLIKPGFKASYPTSRTFLFLDALKNQSYPGGNWPEGDVYGITTPGGYGSQVIDYEMDPDVVGDTRYVDKISDAFQDVPTLSVITDVDYLFDENIGIYVNAAGHGYDWERECGFELFDPKGNEEGFNVNAGIRIRGGWSRHPNYPKHSFRMFFRSEYGDSKLRYPLFGDEGVDRFDKIDLRTSQNYAWSLGYSENTMVREVFSRDVQKDMGRPYTRSRYYHLFLNGMYWGLYQTQERSEARFASDYFGDKAEDYDVIKISTENWDYQVEATDGNTEAWRRVYNKMLTGFTDNEDYFWLEGKDENGLPQPGLENLVDIDNLIDYMLIIFYTGNFDAPTSSFGRNNGPNNFYAIVNRNDLDKGFMFFNHDAEHSLFYDGHWPGIGINENRVNIGSRTDEYQMTIGGFNGFHPQWLHYKLAENEEYRVRFADRAVRYLTQGGELTPEQNTNRFMARANQIETAIIAESARWGDQGGGAPKTKDDHWDREIDQTVSQFIPARTTITINQLRNENLFPFVDAPEIYRNSNLMTKRMYKVDPGWIISMENPNSGGTLYYTLDGTDPRLLGGALSSSAIEAEDQHAMTITASTLINARVFQNGNWSGLKQISFISADDNLSNLKITEIHYHPQDVIVGTDTTSGKDFEFLEFKNIGASALNLSGVVVDSAVYFEFPENTLLGPGQFYVIMSKPSGFYSKYGRVGSGNFRNNLANGGERIVVFDASGEEFINFVYDDKSPWPEMPDGDGPSMVSAEPNPTGDPGDPFYWRASYHIDGSPFADDLLYNDLEEYETEDRYQPELTVFPNPSRGTINLLLDTDNPFNEMAVRIYQLDGQLIYAGNHPNQGSINLSEQGLVDGVYILQLRYKTYTYTKKIIYTP